ncbi:glycosyltransferase family 4 protein [Planococcus sp. CAU13]|uniref:glycosyltransferase family 4 protein n=1 Tax=Planococcus sp. CAU13 TaxID=1541197 RepID=UPI00053001FF|nr:glycosyltransferase family 4 protein [Planococcus sp. CAU13]
MKKKKIVFVINYFYPDLASTGQLMTDLCLHLQSKYDITVVATQPHYANQTVESIVRFETEYLERIKVVRIKMPNVIKESKISRIKYITSYFLLANIALLKEKNTDIIYTISQPPVLGGLIGTIGKVLKNSKHVYNIQDFNPEQAIAINYAKSKIVTKIAKKIDMINCSFSDCIVLVGSDMKNTLETRFADKKVPNNIVINNWTDEENLRPLSKTHDGVTRFLEKYKLEDKFIIMYSGNIGLYYDLENIIQVILKFKNIRNLAFVFIGDGATKKQLEEFKIKNNMENVYFLPYQDKEEIKYSFNAANVHLVVNQKGIKGVSVPSKIYGVMAAGKPIIGVLEKGSEAAEIISASDCGILVEPKEYEEIFGAIKMMIEESAEDLESMGLKGREYLDLHFKKVSSLEKYERLFEVL